MYQQQEVSMVNVDVKYSIGSSSFSTSLEVDDDFFEKDNDEQNSILTDAVMTEIEDMLSIDEYTADDEDNDN